jgi:hypothetical protein
MWIGLFSKGRDVVKMTNIALLVGLSIAALASPAMAAMRNLSAAATVRDATRAACNADAYNSYPGSHGYFGPARTFVYENCMHDHGYAR